jgi:hypothetical protein
VDFVFSLLTQSIGAVAKLVLAGTMHGSVGRLYQSMGNINGPYLLLGADKSELLQPSVLHPDAREPLLLSPAAAGAGDGERGGLGDAAAAAHVQVVHVPGPVPQGDHGT